MKFLSAVLLLLLLVACSYEDPSAFDPSDQLIESNVKFSIIDTMTFKMSTYKFDSIITDVGSTVLVGKYNDPHFGIVKASGFIGYVPKNYNYDEDAVFDSIVIILPYSGYHYNDTLLQKNIKVEQLLKTIRFRTGQSHFYNTSNIAVNGLVGQRTFYPRIKGSDSLKITLNYNFGQNLFNKIRNGVIQDSEELELHFKGLKISADDSENASIIGFSASASYLRLYYSIPDEPAEAKHYDFIYNNAAGANKYFSQLSSDRSNTVFPNFVNNETEFFPTAAVPYTYMQSGIGIVTKFSFSHFTESVNNLNSGGLIYKANLKIPLKSEFISNKFKLSDSVQVFAVDQNNDIMYTVYNGSKQAVGYIQKEDADFNKYYLNVPVANFLKESLSNPLYRNYGIIIVPFDYNSSLNRAIFNSEKNPQEKTKLILTYLNYED
ncbi:MAG: DUF4270 family protein [Flavobacterium sp.]